MKYFYQWVATIALCSWCAIASCGELAKLTQQLPEPPAPPQGEQQWIARSMRYNGLPMTVRTFKSPSTVSAVLAFYERWGRGKSTLELMRHARGEVQVLGVRFRDYFISIEARPVLAGAQGTITVSANPESATSVHTRFPHPATTRLLVLQEFEDFGSEAQHISFSSPREVVTEAADFEQALLRDGWQLLSSRRGRTGSHIIEARKHREHAQLVFQRRGATQPTAITVIWRRT